MLRESELLDVLREALWSAVVVSTPVLLAALVVGIAIGLLQALTTVQEMTLTFVPKLGAILAVFWVTMGGSAALLDDLYRGTVIPLIAGG
ncbi:MAG: flagellar biosynthetic protein FliQ [Rubricella sp.]